MTPVTPVTTSGARFRPPCSPLPISARALLIALVVSTLLIAPRQTNAQTSVDPDSNVASGEAREAAQRARDPAPNIGQRGLYRLPDGRLLLVGAEGARPRLFHADGRLDTETDVRLTGDVLRFARSTTARRTSLRRAFARAFDPSRPDRDITIRRLRLSRLPRLVDGEALQLTLGTTPGVTPGATPGDRPTGQDGPGARVGGEPRVQGPLSIAKPDSKASPARTGVAASSPSTALPSTALPSTALPSTALSFSALSPSSDAVNSTSAPAVPALKRSSPHPTRNFLAHGTPSPRAPDPSPLAVALVLGGLVLLLRRRRGSRAPGLSEHAAEPLGLSRQDTRLGLIALALRDPVLAGPPAADRPSDAPPAPMDGEGGAAFEARVRSYPSHALRRLARRFGARPSGLEQQILRGLRRHHELLTLAGKDRRLRKLAATARAELAALSASDRRLGRVRVEALDALAEEARRARRLEPERQRLERAALAAARAPEAARSTRLADIARAASQALARLKPLARALQRVRTLRDDDPLRRAEQAWRLRAFDRPDPRNRLRDRLDPTADFATGTRLGALTGVARLAALEAADLLSLGTVRRQDSSLESFNQGRIDGETLDRHVRSHALAVFGTLLLARLFPRAAPGLAVGPRALVTGVLGLGYGATALGLEALVRRARGEDSPGRRDALYHLLLSPLSSLVPEAPSAPLIDAVTRPHLKVELRRRLLSKGEGPAPSAQPEGRGEGARRRQGRGR